MIGVTVLFVLFAGIVFLGYVLTELFYKIKVAVVLPLMLIGLALGPLFHVVSTSSSSTVIVLVPYITALAVAFILFDVGLRIRLKDLNLAYALRFTFLLSLATGTLLGIAIFLATHLGVLLSFAAGFGLAGPSSVVIPAILRKTRINKSLKATLSFESVVVDSVTLIVPIILIEVLALRSVSIGALVSMFEGFFIGSLIIGVVSAFFWVFILKAFKEHSEEYSWMLTISMVIATYGISQALGANGAITVFVFGVMLANMPEMSAWLKAYTTGIKYVLAHVFRYQREVTFFVSTFLFVYIGLLFQISVQDYLLALVAIGITALVFYTRTLFLPLIKDLIKNKERNGPDMLAARYSVARGLSPVIVATLPLAFGVYAPPSFVGVLFLSILFTNALTTIGMYRLAKAQETKKGETGSQVHAQLQEEQK
ncbi:MAG: cation:proton antiporter [Candidatus Micrarchaeaceae archaeon]